MEDTKGMSKREFKKSYGRLMASIITSAVTEIDAAMGRKVLSLTVPKPNYYENPDKDPHIAVKFEATPQPPRPPKPAKRSLWSRIFGKEEPAGG